MLLIRLDDITPDMNWEKFNKAKSIFDKYNIKPLIGVVPDNQDKMLKIEEEKPKFWDYICQLQRDGWVIAQHGYQHEYTTSNSGILGLNPFSEFAGLPYDVQLDKIRKGKEILQKKGIHAKIFMAPGHTYDKNTLRALYACEFTHVTDGYTKKPYKSCGLSFIPSRISQPRLVKCLDTLCLHTNQMKDGDFEELEMFICKNRTTIKNFEDYLDDNIKQKTVLAHMEEQANLMVRRLKIYTGSSLAIQEYFNRTNDSLRWKKIIKRCLGIPKLLVMCLIQRRK